MSAQANDSTDPRGRGGLRIGVGEAAGAVADLGVMVPLVAALVLVNGLDPGSVLLIAGLLVLASGTVFGVPFPVQPLKALTAVAVAQRLAPDVIHGAGLEIGVFLLLLSIRRVADTIAKAFTKTVVRALQLGVGVLLVLAAERLVRQPPSVFVGTPPSPWPMLLAAGAFVGVVAAARRRWYAVALALLAGGVLSVILVARPDLGGPSVHLPSLALPRPGAMATAFFLLVIPQLPLTFGNAVVATSDLAHEYFGSAARAVTPSRICLSAGLGNVFSAVAGGMPMCHGAGGMTAHYRLGARSAGMNVLLGGTFITAGLFFGRQVLTVLGLLPVWVLAAFLAYAGLRHAFLCLDLRRWALGLAVAAGLVGALSANLALTAGMAIALDHGGRLAFRFRERVGERQAR